jgi:Mrp family chromosome partitioning ATPase
VEESVYQDEGISISELISIVMKHIKLLFLVFGAVVLLSLLYIGLSSPTYTANALIAVDSTKNLTAWNSSKSDVKIITTELQFLSNKETVLSALARLDLNSYKGADGQSLSGLMTDEKKLKSLRKNIEAVPVKDTNFATITFKHTNPVFAVDFLDALIPAFDGVLRNLAIAQLTGEQVALENQQARHQAAWTATKEALDDLIKREQSNVNLTELTRTSASEGASLILGLTSPDLLEMSRMVEMESELLTEKRIELAKLASFLDTMENPIFTLEEAKLENESGDINKMLILAVAILLGGAIGLLATLLAEFVSDEITDAQVLQKRLGRTIPILTTIPEAKKSDGMALEMLKSPDSVSAAAYAQLASILLHTEDKKVYSISSLGYGEGTTFTVMNTALCLADNGKRVLVMGTANDRLLYQKLYTMMSEGDQPVSINSLDLDKPVTLIEEGAHISLLMLEGTNGEKSQLLHSARFASYVKDAATVYDLILIDAPTYKTSANLLATARIADALILNVRSYIGSRKQLGALLHTLELCQLRLDGAILNNYSGKPSMSERRQIKSHNRRMTAIANGTEQQSHEESFLAKASSR